ncbi:MAG TPA: hypothetical protein VGR03_06545 [Candidatus Acidoferrum sp.]|nr:hypothetical protein [Candidatus Acidoferrum sp.]
MLKLKTHFEQVPLEMVKQIVEKELQREMASEQARGTKKKKLEEDLLEASTVNG